MITREQILGEINRVRRQIHIKEQRLEALRTLLKHYESKPNRKGDVAQVAVEVMREATGDPAATSLGSRGGKARAANLDPARRSEIARLAASKRWGTKL